MTYSAIQSNVVAFPSFSFFGRPQTRYSFIFFFYFPPVLGLSVDLFSFLEYCFRFRDHSSLQPNSSAYNTEVLTLRILYMWTCAFFGQKFSQTVISDLELYFQDVNYIKIKSTTEIRRKVCAGREVTQDL